MSSPKFVPAPTNMFVDLLLSISLVCIGFITWYPVARSLIANSTSLPTPPPAAEQKEDAVTQRTIVGGKYELFEVLREGRHALTHRAVDIETGEHYAVKVFKRCDEKRHIMLEVMISYYLSGHRNVVGYKDYFEEEGKGYIVMELVKGKTLRDAIEEGLFKKDDRRIKHVFMQLLDAIEYLHSKKIYHRELKTDNIVITQDGTIKIIDFGESTTKPEAFSCLGTASYNPPEAFTSRLCNSAEADKWALGQILIEMSTCNGWLWEKATVEDHEYQRYLSNVKRGNIMYFHQELPVSSSISAALFMTMHPQQASRSSIQMLRAQLKEADCVVDASGLSPERREKWHLK